MESNCRIDPARSRIYGVQLEIVRNAKTRMLHAARSKGRIWLLALLNCRKLNSFLVEKVASSLDVWFVLSFAWINQRWAAEYPGCRLQTVTEGMRDHDQVGCFGE